MVSLREITATFSRIGVLSFGGPAAQIALLHREVVDRHGWLRERQFLDALSFCMLLPGPEAMQLATYVGWRLAGVAGGLIAGLLFVLPGAAVIMALATLYAFLGDVPFVQAVFTGIKATVVVIVVEALVKVARRALLNTDRYVLAGLAFLGIFFLAVPFPILIALAGIYGWWRIRPKLVEEPAPTATANPPTPGATLCTVVIWLAVWWLPVAGLWLMAPELLTEIALFFSKLAVVTFGGAYAVLAYMAQDVVTLKGWLSPGQMMDALGLAETTPGPLILVTQFVGFVAGFGAGGWASGAFAAAVTLWVTFVPCFLWIFASAPYIDRLATLPRLRGVLDAITAAVVGVILNLSVWFALHVFFADVARHDLGALVLWVPDPATLDLRVVALCTGSAVLLWRGWSVAAILGTIAAVAALMHFIGV